MAHCEAWISKFTTLLSNLAMRELGELQTYVQSSSAELTQLLALPDAHEVCLYRHLTSLSMAPQEGY